MKKSKLPKSYARLLRLTPEQNERLIEMSQTLFEVPISVQKLIIYLLFKNELILAQTDSKE